MTTEETTQAAPAGVEMFIGSAKILDNTFDGETQLVTYSLDNGLVLTATQEQFAALASPEKYDDGKVSMKKWMPTIQAIIQRLKDDNATISDRGWIMERVDESIMVNHKLAIALMYGVNDVNKISLRAIDEKLKSATIKEG